MSKPKQKYQVSMSLGYSTIVEAVDMVDAIEIAANKPCASGGEWGEGVWDSDTIDVEHLNRARVAVAAPETLGEAIARAEAEVGVGTFEWNGHRITNPFMDDTGRFPVTPAHYGFEITNTGGGCTAWVRDEAPGVELWVSGLDSDAATCDCRGWIIGLYYTAENLDDAAMGNDEMEPIWCVTVPVGGERKIDISDPDPRPHLDRQDDVVWLQSRIHELERKIDQMERVQLQTEEVLRDYQDADAQAYADRTQS
jgi:hypothetical protein